MAKLHKRDPFFASTSMRSSSSMGRLLAIYGSYSMTGLHLLKTIGLLALSLAVADSTYQGYSPAVVEACISAEV